MECGLITVPEMLVTFGCNGRKVRYCGGLLYRKGETRVGVIDTLLAGIGSE
jgi:hypothetical protein